MVIYAGQAKHQFCSLSFQTSSYIIVSTEDILMPTADRFGVFMTIYSSSQFSVQEQVCVACCFRWLDICYDVSEDVWMFSLMSAASRWSIYSASFTPNWKRQIKVVETSSIILACHMNVSTVQLTSRCVCRSLLTLHTWRLLTQSCRAKWRLSSTTEVTPTERRYTVRVIMIIVVVLLIIQQQ